MPLTSTKLNQTIVQYFEFQRRRERLRSFRRRLPGGYIYPPYVHRECMPIVMRHAWFETTIRIECFKSSSTARTRDIKNTTLPRWILIPVHKKHVLRRVLVTLKPSTALEMDSCGRLVCEAICFSDPLQIHVVLNVGKFKCCHIRNFHPSGSAHQA